MNKSTPINSIPIDNDKTDSQQTPLVQNILNEIQESEGNVGGGLGNDYNAQESYANSQQNQYERQTDNVFSPEMNQNNYNINEQPKFIPNESFFTKFLNNLKSPVLVLILFTILSLPTFDKYLGIIVPKFYVNNQNITLFGILFKGLFMAVLYYFTKKL